ncbi:thiol reductant ABC exporter subunit CydC [Micrococcus terreus]|uniref:thiol reductant ABC exporter subunit CydC n=1 Tax=Micrococcus terreus TaxID=574650 RepID=UPI003D71E79A
MRPELPASRRGRSAVAMLTLLAGVKAVGWVLLATSLARGVAHLASVLPAPQSQNLVGLLFRPDPSAFDPARYGLTAWAGSAEASLTVVLGVLGVLARALAVWGQQVMARRAALGAKEELRLALVRRRLDSSGTGADRAGADAVLASTGLDGMDDWFTQYLPALTTAAVVPLALGVWILAHDWVSALILVLTIPLIPLFMVLIGRYTEDRVEQAADGLDRLSDHLLELARGLPVLVGLRRAGTQRQALAEVSERYRTTTMTTLRTAFMSGFALELISTLSVAVVAVFIGVRLVYGELDLYTGLLVLALAPEVYLPFRDIGAAHHASEDGLEAMRRARAEADRPVPGPFAALEPAEEEDSDPTGPVRLHQVTIAYRDADGAPLPAVVGAATEAGQGGLDLRLEPGLTVLAGASGTGKSTLVGALAGVLRDDVAAFSGSVYGLRGRPVAWLGQHPAFSESTVRAELELYARAAGAQTAELEEILRHALTASALPDLLTRRPDDLSPGERRRLGLARVLTRLMAGARDDARRRLAGGARGWLVAVDEPTAHLDPASAERVRATLVDLAAGRLPDGQSLESIVVAASHDRVLHGRAAVVVNAAGHCAAGQAAAEPPSDGPSPVQTPEREVREETEPSPARLTWKKLLALLPLTDRRFLSGVAWSVAATLSAALLAALSGWLIVQASYQPPVLFLLSVIVMVRFFGIGRALFRYLDRLATHDAVLGWANRVRLRLWDALGSRAALWGRLTRSGGALSLLIADVDELRDAVPRVIVPLPAALVSWAVTVGVVAVMAPTAWWPAAVAGLVGFTVIPVTVWLADRRTSGDLVDHRTGVLNRTSALFSAATDLSANGASELAAERFADADAQASRPLRRSAAAAGLGQALVVAVSGWAAVQSMIVCIQHGVTAPITALVVFLMLALAEPLGLCVTAVQQGAVLRRQLAKTGPFLTSTGPEEQASSWVQVDGEGTRVSGAELDQVSARYPGTGADVFTGATLQAQRGELAVVTGPSGSGKSTLLAVLLGFLRPRTGTYTLRTGQVTEAAHRSAPGTGHPLQQVAWCPQDAALFDSTLRSNLALSRAPQDRPGEEEMVQVLRTVGLGPWLDAAPHGLDTRVGPAGHRLSGGQRQRVAVARALLARADVVLLDEPTAHLGEDEAEALMQDLAAALEGVTTVLVTHDRRFIGLGTHHLDLGAARSA